MNSYYAVKNKKYKIRKESSSGGFFSAIAEWVITNSGIVYGASLDNNGRVFHIGVESISELEKIRGSKYVQSDLSGILNDVKLNVDLGRLVLFSGTPCQCAAALKIVGDRKNFITTDLICHGVSSPKLFKSYWDFLEKSHCKIRSYKFRDKKYPWVQQRWSVEYEDNTHDSSSYEMKSYKEIYYKTYAHRECCFYCPFTKVERATDFTMGDFWGIEKFDKSLVDDEGVSIVIVHTEAGHKIWSELSDYLYFWEVKEEDCLQPQLCYPTKRLNSSVQFWKDFLANEKYEVVMKKYGWPSKIRMLKNFVKRLIK